jgi:lysine/ornithine N-monooxygenase
VGSFRRRREAREGVERKREKVKDTESPRDGRTKRQRKSKSIIMAYGDQNQIPQEDIQSYQKSILHLTSRIEALLWFTALQLQAVLGPLRLPHTS